MPNPISETMLAQKKNPLHHPVAWIDSQPGYPTHESSQLVSRGEYRLLNLSLSESYIPHNHGKEKVTVNSFATGGPGVLVDEFRTILPSRDGSPVAGHCHRSGTVNRTTGAFHNVVEDWPGRFPALLWRSFRYVTEATGTGTPPEVRKRNAIDRYYRTILHHVMLGRI
jgi:hypothetical protein